MTRLLLALVLAATTSGTFATPPAEALQNLPNVAFPAPARIASGRLQASDIPALQAAGVREVIDLSTDRETPGFDEGAALRKAGITYHHLPIHGASDLDGPNVARFNQLLADAGDKLTLVHCASGNRVGAMIALRGALFDGKTTEAALVEGRRWGLKSLEPAVRERLEQRPNTWSPASRH